MQKFTKFVLSLVMAFFAIAANAQGTPTPEDEIGVALVGEDDSEITLNTHSNVTVDVPVKGIVVTGLQVSPTDELTYAIYDKRNAIAEGVFTNHGKAYAEFGTPVKLYEGIQYNVVVKLNGETTIYDGFVIGAMEEEVDPVEVALVADDFSEFLLNSHSTVTVDKTIVGISLNGVKVNPIDEVTYAIYDKRNTLAEGKISVKGKSYAELDTPVNLYEGIQYNVVVKLNDEITLYDGYVIGAMEEEENKIEVALVAGDNSEFMLNDHSTVTVDKTIVGISVDGVKVNPIDEVTYAIYDKRNTLAEGTISFHGKGFAEFGAPVNLYEGIQYNVVVTLNGETTLYDGIVIGAMEEEPVEIAVALVAEDETEFKLNDHSIVTVDVPVKGIAVEGLKVNPIDEVTYAIYDKRETIAEGTLSINDKVSYAEFDNVVKLYEGIQYNVVIKLNGETTYDAYVIGAMEEEPVELAVSLVAEDETEYALNSHSTVTVDVPVKGIAVEGIKVNPIDEVTYAIYDKRNTIAEGTLSINDKVSYAEFDNVVKLYEGIQYNVVITLNGETTLFDGYVIGAMEEEPVEIAVSLVAEDETEYALNSHSTVTVDVPVKGIAVEGLKVNPIDEVTYAIYDKRNTIAEGTLSINNKAYADFANIVELYEGIQYNVVITLNGETTLFDGTVIGACEEPTYTVETAIIAGEDYIALNDHSDASAEAIKSIEVSFDGVVPTQAYYTLSEMIKVTGEEGTTWENGNVLAEGELALSGKGFADFDEAIILNQGTKYQLVINWKTMDNKHGYVEYGINGSTPADPIEVTLIADEENEYIFNGHTAPTVDKPISAIKVSGLGTIMEDVNYAIFGMDKTTLASGVLSVNNIGYAEFPPVTMYEGKQYNVIISIKNEVVAEYQVIGACEDAAYTVETAIIAGEDYITLNDHSDVSAEAIKAIEVSFDGVVPAKAFYTLSSMVEVSGEEGTTWENGDVLAQGELTLSGRGFAELNEAIILAQGNKYQLVINWNTMDNQHGFIEYGINGAYVDEPAIEVSLIANENEYTLNTHSMVTVDQPVSAIKVTGLDQNMQEVKFAIYSMAGTMAEGTLSVNTIGYAEFENPIILQSGVKYNVVLTSGEETIYDAIVIGAVDVAPAVEFWNSTVLLQDGAEIDLAETKSININIELPDGVNPDDDLYLEGMVYGKDGTQQPIFAYTTFAEGTDVAISRLAPGNSYQIAITKIAYGNIIGTDEETYMPIYDCTFEDKNGLATLNIYIKSETPVIDATVEVNGTQMLVIFPEGTDLGDNYANKPYIMSGENVIEIAEYTTDNTTGKFFDPLNVIVITLKEKLADGKYTLVIPEGTFIINGGDNNVKTEIPFTVDTTTGINAVSADKNNGLMFNIAGQQVKNAKGIVIMNGKKVVRK